MTATLANFFPALTPLELGVIGTYLAVAVLFLALHRKAAVRWLLVSQAVLWGYLSQRLIFFFRMEWHGLVLMGVAGAFAFAYAIAEGSPNRRPRPPRPWVEWLLVALIMVVGLWFRVYMFDTLPDGCYFDEAEVGKDYYRMIAAEDFGWYTVFESHTLLGRPATYWFPAGMFAHWFGRNCVAVRLPAVISGMLTLPVFYLLLRHLFGYQVGLLGTMLMSINLWHVIASRVGFSCIQTPLFTIVVVYLFFLGKDRHWLWYGPMLLAYYIGHSSYHPSRVIIAVPMLYMLHRLVTWGYQWLRDRYAWKGQVGLAVGVVALVVGVGFGGRAVVSGVGEMSGEEIRRSLMNTFGIPEDIMNLMGRRFLFTRVSDGRYLETWIDHATGYARMFHFRGDGNPRHNVPAKPAFNWLTGLFLVPGMVYALLKLPWKRFSIPWAILLLMAIPPLISIDAAHFLRSIGTQPAFSIFVAVLFGKLWYETMRLSQLRLGETEERDRLATKSVLVHWSGAVVYAAFLLGVGGFWATSARANAHALFVEYPQKEAVYHYFDAFWYELADYLNSVERTIPGEYEVVLLQEFTGNIPALQYPADNQEPWRIIDFVRDIPLKLENPPPFTIFILRENYQPQVNKLLEYYPRAFVHREYNRFGTFVHYAIWVSDEDVRDGQGLRATYRSQGQVVQRQRNVTIDHRGDLFPMEYPIPDSITWEGLLSIDASDTYAFRVTTDVPFTLIVADQPVLEARPEDFIGYDTRAFEADRVLGKGQYAVRLEAAPTAASTTLVWEWSYGTETFHPVPLHRLLTGEVIDPESFGVMYAEEPLRLDLVSRWKHEIPGVEWGAKWPTQLHALHHAPNGELYAVRGPKVAVYDTNGTYLRHFGGFGHLQGQLTAPESIIHDRNGHIYINDYWHHKVQKYTEDGEFLQKVPIDPFNQLGIFDDGTMVVGNRDIIQQVVDDKPRTLRYLQTERDGIPALQPKMPMGIVTNGVDRFYLSDRAKERVWQFDRNANLLRSWIVQGQDYKSQMAVDGEGRIYVTTFPNNNLVNYTTADGETLQLQQKVQCFTPEGVGVLLDLRNEQGESFVIRFPVAIAAGQGRNVYIGDVNQNTIYHFRYAADAPPAPAAPEETE